MIITLVIDQYGEANNGTTMTARRFAETLRKHGHTVRVLGGDCFGEEILFSTGINKTPILYQVCNSQGMVIGKVNKKICRQAVDGADVVHFLLPFSMERYTKKYCDKMGIATTAAFHCQPENISSTIHCGKSKPINDFLYHVFKSFYKKFEHIHCPSQMIADQLKAHNYKGEFHVISNGVSDFFKPMDVIRPKEYEGKILLLMVGRYSVEKRQDLIINAVKKSKYEKQIQIILAGKGPWKSHLESLAKGLTNPVIFGFYNQEELRNVINYSDIYVHASDAEIEAISCMEAFTCGMVPIISDNPLVATRQFALDEHNLFESGNIESLQTQIEYWIEHPELKREFSKKYIEYAKQYQLDACVLKLEEVFKTAIKENQEKNK